MAHTMLAQVPDPISGGAGWVGAGLLGLVLFWLLMRHLPAKDQQIERIIGKHDTTIDALAATFKQEAMAERLACEKHFGTLAEAMSKGNEATMAAFRAMTEQVQNHAARNQQWSTMLDAKVKELDDVRDQVRRQVDEPKGVP
jgi:hypothetical protein